MYRIGSGYVSIGYGYVLVLGKYRLYNEVEVSTGYTRPSAVVTRLCIP